MKILLPAILATLILPATAAEIAVSEIGGLPVIRGKIRHEGKEIEANILFDPTLSVPIVIHSQSIGRLDINPTFTTGKLVDIILPGETKWKNVPLTAKRIPLLENLTSKYAPELKEVPVVAIIGLQAIGSNVVELNLSGKWLRTLGIASAEARAAEFDYEEQKIGTVLNGIGPERKPVKILLTPQDSKSFISTDLLTSSRKAGVKPNFLEINGVNISDHAAFRFTSIDSTESIDVFLGSRALRDFTVTFWPKRKKMALLPGKRSSFRPDLQNYFFSLEDKDITGIKEFISRGAGKYLMDEACLNLWNLRLKDPASTEAMLTEALKIIAENYDPIRRSKELTRIADALRESKRADKGKLSGIALGLAMAQSAGALDQTAAHRVHIRLGRIAFEAGDLTLARRHLLSAAFGMPKNAKCNYWLGQVYAAMGKPRRAWSRYFQALLDPQVKLQPAKDPTFADCLDRLDELNGNPAFRAEFDMVEAEEYLAGRLEGAEFHAPSRFALEKRKFPGHVKLVEFFTDTSDRSTGGMQLAFQALDEHFSGDVALIEYHLNDPMDSQVAKDRLKFYGAGAAPMAVFDGKPLPGGSLPGGKNLSENAASNYPPLLAASLLRKDPADPAWALEATIGQNGNKVSGSVSVSGNGSQENLRLHVILCERSVMAVGKNSVFFHHFVARKSLTPLDGLDLKTSLKKPLAFSVDTEEMRQALDKPGYVDPAQLSVVAFVQDTKSRRILAAKSFKLPEEGLE